MRCSPARDHREARGLEALDGVADRGLVHRIQSRIFRLTQIAFTELKIDRSFVHDALMQDSSRAMLESSLEMARKLRITSVAEGVERNLEWALLRDLGCDLAQGFLIARPLDRESYLDWLRRTKRGP